MGFNSYINYLKPSFYNKIKVLIHIPLKKLFYVAGCIFFFLIALNMHYLTKRKSW